MHLTPQANVYYLMVGVYKWIYTSCTVTIRQLHVARGSVCITVASIRIAVAKELYEVIKLVWPETGR